MHESFSVPIRKEIIKIDKDGNKSVETISYEMKFIDRFRFMNLTLSSLVDNLSEIYSEKCRDKNCRFECEFKGDKNKKLSYNCQKCRKEQLKPMNGLIKKKLNAYELCNGDVNKFILLLGKGVYLSEFMDSWERFNKVQLSEKEAFFSE